MLAEFGEPFKRFTELCFGNVMSSPSHDYHLVEPSPWPALGALAGFVFMGGLILYMHPSVLGESTASMLEAWGGWLLFPGTCLILLTMALWWRDVIAEAHNGDHKPVVQLGLRYGMVLFIVSEIMFFVAFFWAFFNASLFPTEQMGGTWPPEGIRPFDAFGLPFTNTVVLLLSGTTATWAHRALIEGDRAGLVQGLSITVVLGILFTALQAYEYTHAAFALKDGIYGSTFCMAKTPSTQFDRNPPVFSSARQKTTSPETLRSLDSSLLRPPNPTLTHPPPPQKSTAVALARRQRIRHRLYGATTLLLFSLLLAHSYRADRSDAASHAITLFADFLKVQGLRAGDPVTLGGVTIGKVTKVTLQKPSMNVRVQIAVDDSLAIPSDSSAVIRAQNLSGNMVLVVEAGGEEQTLQEGDFFSFSREPIELPQLITTIVERAERHTSPETIPNTTTGAT